MNNVRPDCAREESSKRLVTQCFPSETGVRVDAPAVSLESYEFLAIDERKTY